MKKKLIFFIEKPLWINPKYSYIFCLFENKRQFIFSKREFPPIIYANLPEHLRASGWIYYPVSIERITPPLAQLK